MHPRHKSKGQSSPSMYSLQRSMNSPSVYTCVRLSTISVQLISASRGSDASPALRSQLCGLTTQMPSPVDPRFCLSTRSVCRRLRVRRRASRWLSDWCCCGWWMRAVDSTAARAIYRHAAAALQTHPQSTDLPPARPPTSHPECYPHTPARC